VKTLETQLLEVQEKADAAAHTAAAQVGGLHAGGHRQAGSMQAGYQGPSTKSLTQNRNSLMQGTNAFST
jgi:hypothetical protein